MARADCIPHKAFVLLWISDVQHHTYLRNGVANVVVQEGEFQSSPDRSLAPLFEDHRHQGGNDDRFHYSCAHRAYVPRSVSLPPHRIQRGSDERDYNAYHACGDQRLEERRRTKSKDILMVFVEVGQFMLIGSYDKPPVTERAYALMLSRLPSSHA